MRFLAGLVALFLAQRADYHVYRRLARPLLLTALLLAPLAALHLLFAPSIGLLRSVSVASGALALAVNFWLCSRSLGRSTAAASWGP